MNKHLFESLLRDLPININNLADPSILRISTERKMEVLIQDGHTGPVGLITKGDLSSQWWRDRVNEAGLTSLSPQQWYQQWTKANAQHKAVSLGCATENVNELWTLCQVASSHPNEVKMAAINRRL